MSTTSELVEIVGAANVIRSDSDLKPFTMDKSYLAGILPIAVVRPRTAEQISKIVKFCNKRKINIVTRGGGSALTGSSVPTKNSVVIDMSHFAKILDTHLEDQYVVVEPYVIIDDLNKHLLKYNYFYPPEPASSAIATIGGSIATNAGGMRAVMYGSTKQWVLGLELVLPTGEMVQTGGRTLKRSVGYDLTSLMVGSEGTLGIITKAILKIIPKPAAVGKTIAYYSSIDDAVSAVSRLKKAGMPLIGAEFLGRSSIEMLRKYDKIVFPRKVECMLMVDVASTPESIGRLMNQTKVILKESNPLGLELHDSKRRITMLYSARKGLFNTALTQARKSGLSVFISDVIVPTSELPVTLASIIKEVGSSNFETQLFSHIGDGNIHVNIIAHPKTELRKVELLLTNIAVLALEHNGSVSGEHGIGLEKKELLIRELKKRNSIVELDRMRKIKKVFDPNGILNKGKIFD